ncbi:MAG TPA: bacillithiol biosynthesis cysteine-adding enzyme BshC [Chitinophagaceae bacterium]|nr:bacillithiol biosynthesis cysteine-adding enzyme BshC [Chitinophagaceae bacterium]
MDCIATRLPYRQTKYFNKIILDYIDQNESLQFAYQHPVSVKGIQSAIESRKKFKTDRKLLVEVLKKQYADLPSSAKVNANIESLLSENTFTISSAHQTNIFTGPLYFIYKIIHSIRLAEQLSHTLPENNFVPVFYIGSEDADLDELNHVWVAGEKLTWHTDQNGAVGRMLIDKELIKILDTMEGSLSVLPHGKEIVSQMRNAYSIGKTIQDATFHFVHSIFAEYGLVILLPDYRDLKGKMQQVFEDDLFIQSAAGIVENATKELTKAGYKVQAHPREINLFYLKDNIRERIVEKNGEYAVLNTDLKFSKQTLLTLLKDHPEYFSPNVILRGLYQETILPNIAFIGGGGETAYWLQLKNLFEYYKTPFPVLVLRNSFQVLEKKWFEKINKLGLNVDDFFLGEQALSNKMLSIESKLNLSLAKQLNDLTAIYAEIKNQATAIDKTLEKHVAALAERAKYRVGELEKKMIRVEKRKYITQKKSIQTINNAIFPSGSLQERKENLSYFYALWGNNFIKKLYENSLALEQEFVVLTEIK